MPPNADVSRLRNRLGSNIKDEDEDAAMFPTSSIKDLKGTEVCIDGAIYDLSDFDHPGGNSIRMYGGNDVTVMYKMMHPYHTEKHLEKMRKVGVVSDFKCEYEFDTEFEREIKREVFKIVRRGREFGTTGYLARAVFYILLLAVMQYAWVKLGSSFTLAIGLGVAQAFIGLNVQHDANHGAASRKAWVNDLLGFGADFIGGQKWNWMQQHTTHHAYCNHVEKDPDSFSAEPMMLFNDYPGGHPNRKFYHKFQALYFLPVLSMYWVSMILNPQVFTLKQGGAASVGIKMDNDFLKSRRKVSTALRLLYIYWNVVTPFFFHNPLLAVSHILFMGTCESLTLALLFSLSHNFENSDRDPTAEYRKTGKKSRLVQGPGRDLQHLWWCNRWIPNRGTELSSRTSPLSPNVQCLLSLHCAHCAEDLCEAWCSLCVLPLGMAEFYFDCEIYAPSGHRLQLGHFESSIRQKLVLSLDISRKGFASTYG